MLIRPCMALNGMETNFWNLGFLKKAYFAVKKTVSAERSYFMHALWANLTALHAVNSRLCPFSVAANFGSWATSGSYYVFSCEITWRPIYLHQKFLMKVKLKYFEKKYLKKMTVWVNCSEAILWNVALSKRIDAN